MVAQIRAYVNSPALFTWFDSADQLDAYVKSAQYGSAAAPPLSAGIIITRAGAASGHAPRDFAYTLRTNASSDGAYFTQSVDDLQAYPSYYPYAWSGDLVGNGNYYDYRKALTSVPPGWLAFVMDRLILNVTGT